MKNLIVFLTFCITISTVFSAEYKNANVEENTISKSKLENIFKNKIDFNDEFSYIEVPRGIVISIADDVLFCYDEIHCQLAINPEAYPILNAIGDVMNSIDNKSNIEGHCENAGLNLTEWEYSMVKSDLIVEYLIKRYPKLHSKIMALGYGNFEPYSAEILNSNNPKLDNRIDFVIIQYDFNR